MLLGILFRRYQLNKFKLAKHEVKDILMDTIEINEGVLRYRLSKRGLSFTNISFALLMKELELEKTLMSRLAYVDSSIKIYSLVCNIPGPDED
jgi:hypothetical protein